MKILFVSLYMGVTIRQYQASATIRHNFEWKRKPANKKQTKKKTPIKLPKEVPTDVIYVSFYTLNKPYIQFAQNLIKSLEKFKLPYDIESIEPTKSWKKTTFYKPKFIKKMMKKHKNKDIVWLDADSEIVAFPKEFYKLNETKYDIASVFRKDGRVAGLHNCVIYLRNNKRSMFIVKEWIRELKKRDYDGDQTALQNVLRRHNSYVQIYRLPHGYAKKSG